MNDVGGFNAAQHYGKERMKYKYELMAVLQTERRLLGRQPLKQTLRFDSQRVGLPSSAPKSVTHVLGRKCYLCA